MLDSQLSVFDPENTVSKIRKYLELIGTKVVISSAPAKNAKVCRHASASHKIPSSEDYEWEDFDASQTFDFGTTKYDWFAFQGDVEAPKNYDPKVHVLQLEFNVSRDYLVRPWDDDTPAGPEGRIWLNGKAFTAIDEFHRGATVHETGHVEVRVFTARCKSKPELKSFKLSLIHKKTQALHHRIRFLLTVVKELPQDSRDRHMIVKILDMAVRQLDIRDLCFPIPLADIRQHDQVGSAFYKSVDAAYEMLINQINKLPKPTDEDPAISVIGYSHIDTCWLWPYNITRFKLANTATTMLRLLESPPDEFAGHEAKYRFLATTPQHYKWLKEDSPEIFERVKEAIKNGRWNADGVSWVEPDTSLPCGESLVRQVVLGIRFFEKEFAAKQTVLFLPDCFGFSANLPQILRCAGIDSFVTSKISWCEYTKFPYSTFVWRGIDGTDLLTHFITTPSSWNENTATYTGVSTAYEMIGTLKHYKQRNILPTSALHTSGNGDGGGGITEEMIWNINLMTELPRLNNVPRLIFPTLEELFIPIRQKANELPIWDDELYLEYHRGTLTSQEEVKRQNRQLEAHLHNCEWLCTILRALFNSDLSKFLNELESIWESTLLFHFHDAIPGSSVNEANQDIIKRGRPLLKRLREIQTELSNTLSSHIKQNTGNNEQIVFNTLSHDRHVHGHVIPASGWLSLSKELVSKLFPIDNSETTTYERTLDRDNENSYVMHTLQEPFISTYLSPFKSSKIIFDKDNKTVTTPFFRIQFAENGTILMAQDINSGRQFFNKHANQFELYEDRPINWPAWDIQLYHKEMQINSPHLLSFDFQDDCIKTKYEIERVGEGTAQTTTIEQTLTFSEDKPYIDFVTVVNWTQHDKLLKIAFPTDIRSRKAKFGIQFGHIERPTHKNTRRDMARFEANGRWADLSDASGGVAICSDVKAGFDVHEGVMRLSLLKAPMQTDRWADFGIRKFVYRLILHNSNFDSSHIAELSDELNTPVVVSECSANQSNVNLLLQNNSNFVTISDSSIILETLKPAYDNSEGFIARFYESTGGWRKCTIKLPLLESSKWKVELVNLLETPLKESSKALSLIENEKELTINLEFNAFQLISVLFTKKH